MADCFIGEIRGFGFNYPPQGWLPCDGRQLPIAQYQALCAVIGHQYDQSATPASTMFCLPDLRGLVPIHQGSGTDAQGNSDTIIVGGKQGDATVALNTPAVLPSHQHAYTSGYGTQANVLLSQPATTPPLSLTSRPENIQGTTRNVYKGWSTVTPDTTMGATMLDAQGAGAPHDNHQPYLTLNFCICVEGVFPVRS